MTTLLVLAARIPVFNIGVQVENHVQFPNVPLEPVKPRRRQIRYLYTNSLHKRMYYEKLGKLNWELVNVSQKLHAFAAVIFNCQISSVRISNNCFCYTILLFAWNFNQNYFVDADRRTRRLKPNVVLSQNLPVKSLDKKLALLSPQKEKLRKRAERAHRRALIFETERLFHYPSRICLDYLTLRELIVILTPILLIYRTPSELTEEVAQDICESSNPNDKAVEVDILHMSEPVEDICESTKSK